MGENTDTDTETDTDTDTDSDMDTDTDTDTQTDRTKPRIVDLSDGRSDEHLLGGKGANLSRLHEAGLNVPPGFCVTTAGFGDILERIETSDEHETDKLDRLREAIYDCELPDSIRDGVLSRLKAYDADSFVVRSSAVAEDAPDASFAGQHESYVNVSPSNVPARIRDCMASLYAPRAVQYRAEAGYSTADARMAVVVQPLIDGDVSGVLATADPETGNRSVGVIEAVYGLAPGVVDGMLPTDTVRVDRSTGEIASAETAQKTQAVTAREATDDGTETRRVEDDRREQLALTETHVQQLNAVADAVTAVFGSPQDVEWTIVDGDCYVLQSRPLPSMYPVPEPAPDDDQVHVYLSMGHQQTMTDPLPPLVRDIWRALFENAADRFRPADTDATIAVEAGGRLFVDITPFLQIPPFRRRIPQTLSKISEPGANALVEFLTRQEEEGEGKGKGEGEGDIHVQGPLEWRWNVVTSCWRGADVVGPMVGDSLVALLKTLVTGPPDIETQWDWTESLGQELCRPIRARPDVSERFEAIITELDVTQTICPAVPYILLFRVGLLAETILRRQFPESGAAVDDLTVGFENEVIARMNRERPRSEEQQCLESSLAEFLDRFGHRAGNEIDFSVPRWQDDPDSLVSASRFSTSEPTGDERFEQLQQRWRAARDELLAAASDRTLGTLRVPLVRRAIRTYRNCLQLREFPKHGVTHLFAAIHETVSEAGHHLVEQDKLDQHDDVWFLRAAELQQLLDSSASSEGVKRQLHP